MFWHWFYFYLHACLQHCGTRKPCQRCKMMRPVKIHATDALTKCSINAATVAVPLALFTLFRILGSHVSTSMPQGREERTYLSCFPKAFLLFRFFPPYFCSLSSLLSFFPFFLFFLSTFCFPPSSSRPAQMLFNIETVQRVCLLYIEGCDHDF